MEGHFLVMGDVFSAKDDIRVLFGAMRVCG